LPTAIIREGFVTLPGREREMSAPQELSGRRDCGLPRSHRVPAKHLVGLSATLPLGTLRRDGKSHQSLIVARIACRR
jgi:hypothetical protein